LRLKAATLVIGCAKTAQIKTVKMMKLTIFRVILPP